MTQEMPLLVTGRDLVASSCASSSWIAARDRSVASEPASWGAYRNTLSQVWRPSFLCLVGLLVGGCVTTAPSAGGSSAGGVPLDQIQIKDRFEVVNIDAGNLGREAHRCVPELPAGSKSVTDAAAKLPLPRGNTVALSHLKGSSWLIVSGATAICIPRSTAGFPIFASEAFFATVNPGGVPPTVTDGWYVQLARRLAEKGRVSAAYIFSNGNATIASYWVEPTGKNFLYYASEFKKAGTWESGTYDFRFTDPNMTSASSVKRGNSSMKVNLIDHR